MQRRSRTLTTLCLAAVVAAGASAPAHAAASHKGKRAGAVGSSLRDTTNALAVTLRTAAQSTSGTVTSVARGQATPATVRNGATRTAASLLGTVSVAVGGVSKTLGALGGTSCDQDVSQPFAPWNDLADYTLMPGGDFEAGRAGWEFLPGVSVVEDQEPWRVTAPGDTKALALEAGATSISPPMCGGLTHPTVRMFAKGTGVLRVDVVYPDQEGLLRSATIGHVAPSADWQPTRQMLTLSGLPLLTGGSLALSVTATGGPVTIDDVYVDPVRRR